MGTLLPTVVLVLRFILVTMVTWGVVGALYGIVHNIAWIQVTFGTTTAIPLAGLAIINYAWRDYKKGQNHG